jgi:hypothetical protein
MAHQLRRPTAIGPRRRRFPDSDQSRGVSAGGAVWKSLTHPIRLNRFAVNLSGSTGVEAVPAPLEAALTQPAGDDPEVREVFSVSHPVAAAYRADVRRLRRLETEKAQLSTIHCQQQRRRGGPIARGDEPPAKLGA